MRDDLKYIKRDFNINHIKSNGDYLRVSSDNIILLDKGMLLQDDCVYIPYKEIDGLSLVPKQKIDEES